MDITKFKYSKCPYCKEYGIRYDRGVGPRSNYSVNCRHCNKTFKVNWAFSLTIKLVIIFGGSLIFAMISNFIIPVSPWIAIFILLIVYISTQRFYPMEEVTPNYICSCCTLKTLYKNPAFSKEICSVCHWQNDTSVNGNRTIISDKNGISLDEAKNNFARLGVCKPEYTDGDNKV